MEFEKEERRVRLAPGETRTIIFRVQRIDRVLSSVGVCDGGPDVTFGEMKLGGVLWDRKPVTWPIALNFSVELHNGGEDGRMVLVEAWHRDVNDVFDTPSEEPMPIARTGGLLPGVIDPWVRLPSDATAKVEKPDVLHTITIRIRKDGIVDGDLDGVGPIYARGDQTTDGQCVSVLQEALLKVISLDIARRHPAKVVDE